MKRHATSRRNGLAGAAAVSESWHGRGVKRVREVEESYRVRTDLADLGGLQELVLDRAWPNVLCFGKDVRVCATPAGPDNISRQLYFEGGKQKIDLEAAGITELHDKVPLGEVISITYWAKKDHLGTTEDPWEHQFGDEGGDRPLLVYDCLNKRLELVGGSYYIDLTDYDGQHSAGIRN